MKEKGKTAKSKIILAIVLVIVLLVTGIGSYFALAYQAKPKINDKTLPTQQQENATEQTTEEKEPGAVISQNVTMYTADDATKINSEISNVRITTSDVCISVKKDSDFNELGKGDIFFLEGSEETPFGETYIGKVVSKSTGKDSTEYVLETPMVDEVFDVLTFSMDETLTADDITTIEAVPGVTITKTDDYSGEFDNPVMTSSTLPGATAQTLDHKTSDSIVASDTEKKPLEGSLGDKLLIDYTVDIFEIFGLNEEQSPSQKNKVYKKNESGRINVYTTKTGKCYHNENCRYLSKSKIEQSLLLAVEDEYRPCTVCVPPIISDDDDVLSLEPTLEITGKIGFDSFDFGVIYDINLLSGEGVKDLSVWANANFVLDATLKSEIQLELSARKTQYSFSDVKLQGLKEKMFPIAFIGYNGAFTPVVSGNDQIRMLTGAVPITVGFIVFVDIYGNVSLTSQVSFTYNKNFNVNMTIVRNGEWVFEGTKDDADPDCKFTLSTELSGDADIHAGASLNLYVFNLNLLELSIIRVGFEAEGMLGIEFSTEGTIANSFFDYDKYIYARAYLKLFGFDVKLKASASFFGKKLTLSKDLSYSELLTDHTIHEWGKKNSTKYIAGQMSYASMTASDKDAIYYKDLDGNLIREEDGYKKTIFSQYFFSICGIDETYLYVLIPDDSGNYDIYRIKKEGSTYKKIAEDVSNCLTIDSTYIYYTQSFDNKVIYRFDRSAEKEEHFSTLDYPVQFMTAQDKNFYVVAEDDSFFASFFGSSSYCYLLDSDGKLIADYGSSPSVENYCYTLVSQTYYTATRYVSSGYLRSTASEMYWVAKDKSANALTEGISGWNPSSKGIFTTLDNDSQAENALPYQIVVFNSSDGSKSKVTEVNSNQAFFTLCESSQGDWYFFDQTDTELLLYKMSSDFSNKTLVKSFLLSDMPCDLGSCGTQILNDRIYFYTMTDNKTSKVLHRYDII